MPNFRGARQGTTSQRGYGADHVKARAKAFAALPEHSPCVRCGRLMWKWAKDRHGRSALHYDHTNNRDGYLGFSCRTCNIRAGAAKGGKAAAQRKPHKTKKTWTSREW